MNKFLKYLLYFITMVVALAAGLIVYLIWFQPAFYFPKPTGQYAVGSKEYHWVDTKRKELYSADPEHPYRELMVKIWYPANGTLPEKPTTPYAPYLVNYSKKTYPLTWLLVFARHIYSYGRPNLEISSDISQFPVIIFSHGFRGTRDTNTAQCEELASHGYVVVGINHTYDSCITQFPDGRIVDGLKSIAQRTKKTGTFDKVINDQAETWITDTHFVLDQLEQLAKDKNSIFYQRFDQNHIGMFGHSMGGSTAFQAGNIEYRIKAVVNLDGDLFGYHIPKKIDKPAMNILGGTEVVLHERPFTHKDWKRFGINSIEEERQSKASFLPHLKQLAQSADHDFYTFVIKEAGHLDIADLAPYKTNSFIIRILAKLEQFNYANLRLGSINGFRATEIVNAYLVNFFDKYLKGKPSALLDGAGKLYPEVEVRRYEHKQKR